VIKLFAQIIFVALLSVVVTFGGWLIGQIARDEWEDRKPDLEPEFEPEDTHE
jgi:hypothetical protein